MKILMIDSLVGNDYALCLCSSLSKAAADVKLVATQDREVSNAIDFPVLRLAPSKNPGQSRLVKTGLYVRYLFKLLQLILRQRIKVVHFQFFRRERAESLYFMLLRIVGVNLIYTAHNILPHENSRIDYFLKYIVYRTAKKVIVHSEHIKHQLANAFRIDRDKIDVIPHGNFDIYLPDKEISQSRCREELGLAQGDFVLLFFGFIRQYKGLDLLLDAFDIASHDVEQAKLLIAGMPHSKALERRYNNRIAKIAAQNRIIRHFDYVPSGQIATFFTACDIVMLPYIKTYHSGIVHVAYSFKRPVIATDVGDFRETVDVGQSGYIVEKDDPESLAASIVSTARLEKDQLKRMGDYGKNLNDTRYSWDNIANKTLKLYEMSLKPHQSR